MNMVLMATLAHSAGKCWSSGTGSWSGGAHHSVDWKSLDKGGPMPFGHTGWAHLPVFVGVDTVQSAPQVVGGACFCEKAVLPPSGGIAKDSTCVCHIPPISPK